MENLTLVFQKDKKRKKTHEEIKFLRLFTSCRKVLRKMPDHQNQVIFQVSHQQAVCILQPSRVQSIHRLLLHISFFGNLGFIEKHCHCRHHETRPEGHL